MVKIVFRCSLYVISVFLSTIEIDWEHQTDPYIFSPLFAWFPPRHAFHHANCFFVTTTTDATEHFDVRNGTIGFDDKADNHPSTNTFF